MNTYKHTLNIINLTYNIIKNAIHDNNLHLPWAAMVCKCIKVFMSECREWRVGVCVCEMLHLWSLVLYSTDEGYRLSVSVCRLLFLWSHWPLSRFKCLFVCGWVQTLAQAYSDILPFDPSVSCHWSSPTYSADGPEEKLDHLTRKKQRREEGEIERHGTSLHHSLFFFPFHFFHSFLKYIPSVHFSFTVSILHLHILNSSATACQCKLPIRRLTIFSLYLASSQNYKVL